MPFSLINPGVPENFWRDDFRVFKKNAILTIQRGSRNGKLRESLDEAVRIFGSRSECAR